MVIVQVSVVVAFMSLCAGPALLILDLSERARTVSLEKIQDRLNELVNAGDALIETSYLSDEREYCVDEPEFHEWRATSLSFLCRVFGENHSHVKLYSSACRIHQLDHTRRGLAVLSAAGQDIAGGHLKSLEALVSADVFASFLDMAEHLLTKGYKDAAAVLLGAVLEDGLRRIAREHGIVVRNPDDISALNQRLAQGGVYSRLTQKRIQVWNDLRNSAAHGRFDDYDVELVKEALAAVTAFLDLHL